MELLDDVRAILKNVEFKVKDKIDILGVLPCMTLFSEQGRQQIEAEENNKGTGYASSSFFKNICSRPKSFFTLLAALLELNQTEIYEVFIEETKKYYRNKPDALREVLDNIEREKRRIGVQDHFQEPDPGRNQDEANSDRHDQCTRPRTGIPRNAHSAEFPPPPQDPPVPQLHRPYSSPAQFSESSTDHPRLCGQIAGQGQSIKKSLKPSLYKKLVRELDRKQESDDNTDDDDDGDPMWRVIAEDEELDLDVSQEDIDTIASGREFLELLHITGYTVDDLERMFVTVGMETAASLLRQRREPLPRIQNNLSTCGSASNIENLYSRMNIDTGTPKTETDKDFKSMPTSVMKGTGADLQPLQPSMASSGSLRSLDSNSSSSNLTDDNVKPSRPIQSIGDPDGTLSAPNPSMDARKLTEDTEALIQTTYYSGEPISVRDNRRTEHSDATNPKSSLAGETECSGETTTQSSAGIPTVVSSSMNTYDSSSFTSGPVTDSNTQAPPPQYNKPCDPPTSAGNIPNIIDHPQAGHQDSPVSALGFKGYAQSPRNTGGGLNLETTRGQPELPAHLMGKTPPSGEQGAEAAGAEGGYSIPISSYADSSVHSVDDIEEDGPVLKGTTAVQPTSAGDQSSLDFQTEAEKLRNDRIHQLDNDPSNLPSFQDIQRDTKQQQQQQQHDGQLPSTTSTHEFRSTMAPPDLIGSLNLTTNQGQSEAGATNDISEASQGDIDKHGEENNTLQNVPNFDVMDSCRSDTTDDSVQ